MSIRSLILPLAVSIVAATSGAAQCQTAGGASQSVADSSASQSVASQSVASSSDSSSAVDAGPKDTQAIAAPAAATPGQVLYTERKEAPDAVDMSPSNVQFGVIIGGTPIEAGKSMVQTYAIANSGNDVAKTFAAYFAEQNGLTVDAIPLPVEPGQIKDGKAVLGGKRSEARYLVDAGPANLLLLYFSMDWRHDDLIFSDRVTVFDTRTGKAVLSFKCFVPSNRDPNNLKTHDELLADNASQLKALINKKTDMCVSMLIDKAKATVKVTGTAP